MSTTTLTNCGVSTSPSSAPSCAMASAVLTACQNSHPFDERRIPLTDTEMKIGRAVARFKPTLDNAVFDCKVLSRNHAVIWYEAPKFFLKDTKSSNGTFVNNQRLSKGSEESSPREIFSGDIVQFGVDIVENAKKVTHGCIMAMIRLFHPDGTEALSSHDSTDGMVSSVISAGGAMTASASGGGGGGGGQYISVHELFQLQQYIREAAHREKMLEGKLAQLQSLLSSTADASESSWQALIDEDRLLSRIEMLESQLQTFSKTATEDKLREEVVQLQREKYDFETHIKDSLRRALEEKVEAVQKLSDVERSLETQEEEATRLRRDAESATATLAALAERHDTLSTHAEQQHEQLQVETVQKLRSDVERSLESQEEEATRLRRDAESATATLAALAERHDTLSTHAEQQHEQLQVEAVQELSDVERSLESQEEEATRLRRDADPIYLAESKVTEMQEQMLRSRREIESRMAEMARQETMLTSKMDSLRVERDHAQEEVANLRQTAKRIEQMTVEELTRSASAGDALSTSATDDGSTDGASAVRVDQLRLLLTSAQTEADTLRQRLVDANAQLDAERHTVVTLSDDMRLAKEEARVTAEKSNLLQERLRETENQVKTALQLVDDSLQKQGVPEQTVNVVKNFLTECEQRRQVPPFCSSVSDGDDKDNRIIELERCIRDLQSQLGDHTALKERLIAAENSRQRLREDAELLEKRMENLRAEHDTKQRCTDQLTVEKHEEEEKGTTELRETKERLTAVEVELAYEKSRHSTAQLPVDHARDTLHRQAAKNEVEFAGLRAECAALRERVSAVDDELRQGRRETTRLMDENRQLQRAYAAAQQRADTHAHGRDALERDAQMVAEQLTSTRTELEELRVARSLDQQEINVMRTRLDDSFIETDLSELSTQTKTMVICAMISLMILLLMFINTYMPFFSSVTATADPSLNGEL